MKGKRGAPLPTRLSGPGESPGFLLWKVSNAWQRKQRAALQPFGLTHSQFVLLATATWFGAKGDPDPGSPVRDRGRRRDDYVADRGKEGHRRGRGHGPSLLRVSRRAPALEAVPFFDTGMLVALRPPKREATLSGRRAETNDARSTFI